MVNLTFNILDEEPASKHSLTLTCSLYESLDSADQSGDTARYQ